MSRMVAGEAEILSIAVSSSQRGKGLWRPTAAICICVGLLASGLVAVFLEVAEDNMPARRLYRRAGFRDVGPPRRILSEQQGLGCACASPRLAVIWIPP